VPRTRGRKRRAGGLGAAIATATSLATTTAFAQDATWLASPGSATFNTGTNWSSGSVPTGTATFGASTRTAITLGAGNVTVGGFQFAAGAPAYTFTGSSLLTFTGAGIDNASASRPVFTFTGGGLSFTGTSSGGSAEVVLGSGSTLNISGLTSTGTTLGAVSGAGNINLGARNLEVGSAGLSGTLGGAISGTGGSLTKTGAGTLTLTGNSNSYSGGTMIAAGTLQLGNGGVTGAIGGNVVNNAKLVFNRTDAVVFNGDISGSGRTVQNTSATLTLNGTISGTGGIDVVDSRRTILAADNSFGGPSTISGFVGTTLQVGAGGATGSIGTSSVTIGGGANLEINRTGALTITGTLSGLGHLVQNGSVATILTADNTYGGNTTINGGSLQLGTGGATGSIGSGILSTVSLAAGTSLIFNRAGTYSFNSRIAATAGAATVRNIAPGSITTTYSIDGTIALDQQAGTLITTYDNTYTRGTTIAAGAALQLGDGGGGGAVGSGAVANEGALVINRSSGTLVIPGAITGAGSLTQIGPGATSLSGANSYGGGTTIEAGRWDHHRLRHHRTGRQWALRHDDLDRQGQRHRRGRGDDGKADPRHQQRLRRPEHDQRLRGHAADRHRRRHRHGQPRRHRLRFQRRHARHQP